MEIYCNKIRKYIAQYISVLNGVDAIVFTTGVGENATYIREKILESMSWFGIQIDIDKNNQAQGKEAEISSNYSKVKVFVIPTDEELIISRDVEFLSKMTNL